MDSRALESFVAKCWEDHPVDAPGVMSRLPDALALVEKPDHLQALAEIITHVSGDHLGRWHDGIALLEELRRSALFDPAAEPGRAVLRSLAVLHHCSGLSADADVFVRAAAGGSEHPPASARARIFSLIAAAMAGQKRTADAAHWFDEALSVASYGPSKDDPASRAIAVAANNLACTLEELEGRSEAETALMLRAAEAARRYWEIAGTWLHVERAEYRLAISNLAASESRAALEHARSCLRIVEANGSDPVEMFFAREALARAHDALGDRQATARERESAADLLGAIVDEETRQFCAAALAKLPS